jgi:hypothetical protein
MKIHLSSAGLFIFVYSVSKEYNPFYDVDTSLKVAQESMESPF